MPILRSRRLFVLLLAALAGVSSVAAENTVPAIVVVGDSISAGYGLPAGQGWVDLLTARIANDGYRYRVVNASITGDTTAGGRARLPALLKQHKPAIVVIELGGNDALRGSRLAAMRDNLDAMTAAAQSAGAGVVLVGMQIPPNYGPQYVREFEESFTTVARKRRATLVPTIFAGFGDDLALFQSDRIHPTAAAQPRLLANVWPALQPMLKKP